MSLQGKRILLGVTGGIAAYKACELLRLLVKAGADVEVMMTKAAAQFVGPLTFETLSGKPVAEDLWDPKMRLPHISLRKNKDSSGNGKHHCKSCQRHCRRFSFKHSART